MQTFKGCLILVVLIVGIPVACEAVFFGDEESSEQPERSQPIPSGQITGNMTSAMLDAYGPVSGMDRDILMNVVIPCIADTVEMGFDPSMGFTKPEYAAILITVQREVSAQMIAATREMVDGLDFDDRQVVYEFARNTCIESARASM